MPDQRRITAEIMREWAPLRDTRANSAPHDRGKVLHPRHSTQTFDCISRTIEGQPGHSRLQDSMPDEEELDCAPSKRIKLNWTPMAWLNSTSHPTGFSTSEAFNKEKVIQGWTSSHCQTLGLKIPHLTELKHHECTCKRFAIDAFGDHLHSCTQHAGAAMGAHSGCSPGGLYNGTKERATQPRNEEGRPVD